MAKVVGIGPQTCLDQTITDPTHGSGSLLLKAADKAALGLTIYGHEMDSATWALARMNMILHGHPIAEIWTNGDKMVLAIDLAWSRSEHAAGFVEPVIVLG